jgi:hypothetical protein
VDAPLENLLRAGEIFMYTIWLQSQMSDMLILKRKVELIPPFVENDKRIPSEMAQLRATYWERQFSSVKDEFEIEFGDQLSEQDISDLDHILHARNMIAHAHVSLARDYMLYRPSGGERKEQTLIDALGLKPIEGQAQPLMLKLQFQRDDIYNGLFQRIKRLDEVCFERLCQSIKVPHGRVR